MRHKIVILGIALAVVLSLVIVIYESVRPQITILWRIPGTTIYRNVKQESSGGFIPNVFIARIGSSMYFANASFIKDMLLAYVEDLQDVNPTEYIVLEMTAVVVWIPLRCMCSRTSCRTSEAEASRSHLRWWGTASKKRCE